MKRKFVFVVIITALFLSACGSSTMLCPYLNLTVDKVYLTSDIEIEYEYMCENKEQRCVYSLYNKFKPEKIIRSEDKVLPNSGTLSFKSLTEGNYKFTFSVYSYRNGEYTLLNYLNVTKEFYVSLN